MVVGAEILLSSVNEVLKVKSDLSGDRRVNIIIKNIQIMFWSVFDGDEMNVHLVQDIESVAELEHLMLLNHHIITPQNCRPCITLVQDCMASIYCLTGPNVILNKGDAVQLHFAIAKPKRDFPPPDIDGKFWSGTLLFSCLLHPTLCTQLASNDRFITIKDGILERSGQLSEKHISQLVHVLCRYPTSENWQYGESLEVTQTFISDAQRLGIAYFSLRGFSVGVRDCIVPVSIQKEITENMKSGLSQAMTLAKVGDRSSALNRSKLEINIVRTLDKTTSGAGAAVKKYMSKMQNNMAIMLDSGSKGKVSNIQQMAACVGQQIVAGQRQLPQFGNAQRSLPSFTKRETSTVPAARGFIKNSYMSGLTANEYFAAAQGGREGMTDTAVKTQSVGYITRKLVKALENVQICYDSSVRSDSGQMIQFKYGEDGFDPIFTQMQAIKIYNMSENDIIEKFFIDFDCPSWLKATLRAKKTLKEITPNRQFGEWTLPLKCIHYLEYCKNIGDEADDDVPTAYKITDLRAYYNKIKTALGEISKEVGHCPQHVLFEALIWSELYPRRLEKYRVTPKRLDWILHTIIRKWHNAKAQNGEKVGIIAAQSIGQYIMQACLNSVSGNTPLLLLINDNELRKVTIGDFVDFSINTAEQSQMEYHPNDTELAWLSENVKILAGGEDGSVSWQKVKAVTRHPVLTGEILRVKLKSGRILEATEAKSFVTIDRVTLKLVPTAGTDLAVGDLVPVCISYPDDARITHLDMKKYVSPDLFSYESHVRKIISDSIHVYPPTNSRNISGITPLAYAAAETSGYPVAIKTYNEFKRKFAPNTKMGAVSLAKMQPNCIYTYLIGHYNIPEKMILDFDFGWLCGIYAAEGSVSNQISTIQIAGVEKDIQDNVFRIGSRWGVRGKVHGGTWSALDCRILAELLKNIIGKGAANKRVHPDLLAAPDEWVAGFLSGYFDGDGHISSNSIVVSSISKGLLQDVGVLASRFGALCTYGKTKEPFEFTPGEKTYLSRALYNMSFNRYSSYRVSQHLRLALGRKNEKVLALKIRPSEYLIRNALVRNDVIGDPIVSIEKIPWTEKVYDLTVDGFKTFNGYDGTVYYDTFHFSGMGNETVNSGFQEAQGLIECSSRQDSTLRLYLQKEVCKNENEAIRIAEHLKYMTLEDAVTSSSVEYGLTSNDKEWFSFYLEVIEGTLEHYFLEDFAAEELNKKGGVGYFENFVISLNLDVIILQSLVTKNLIYDCNAISDVLLHICKSIKKTFEHLHAVPSPGTIETPKILIFMISEKALSNKRNEHKSEDMLPHAFMRRISRSLPACIYLKGVIGITSVNVRSTKESSDLMINTGQASQDEYYIETSSGSLNDCAVIPGIDWSRSYTRNTPYSNGVLGLEGTRAVLVYRLLEIFTGTDIHHIYLLADQMLSSGKLRPISRHTQNKLRYTDVLDRSTNEEGISVLKDGAINNRKDGLNGVSGSIAVGKPVRAGTGSFKIFYQSLPPIPEGNKIMNKVVTTKNTWADMVDDDEKSKITEIHGKDEGAEEEEEEFTPSY